MNSIPEGTIQYFSPGSVVHFNYSQTDEEYLKKNPDSFVSNKQILFQNNINSSNNSSQEEPELDSVVLSIIDKFKQRAIIGKKKYGTTLDREDLSIKDWIQHTQEELMDGILYLEKLKKTISTKDT